MPAQPPTRARKHVQVPLKLWPGGMRLVTDRTKLNHVAVPGIGWGKSYLGSHWCLPRITENLGSSSRKGGIVGPTLRLLKRHIYPYLSNALSSIGIKEGLHYRFHKSDYVLEFGRKFKNYGVYLISAENYQSMVNWEFDWMWHEEPGFASEELNDFVEQRTGRSPGVKLGQVLRTGVMQQPNWYYERFGIGADLEPTAYYRLPEWVSDYAPGWGGREFIRFRENEHTLVLHAASYENHLLNPQYFIRLWESFGWKEAKFRAHVLGEAIALNTLSVYEDFDEPRSVGDYPVNFKGWNPVLNLCFDFNVGRMPLVVCQEYEGSHYAVWENGDDCKTTKAACQEFKAAFPVEKYGQCHLRIFGDSGGWARSAQLWTRDGNYSIIRNELEGHYAKVTIHAPRHSVLQETRVQSTNEFLGRAQKGGGGKGLYADRKCRKLITGWRTASWDPKTGKIKKTGDEDDLTHAPEGVDYYMYREEPPIERPMTHSTAGASRTVRRR